MEGTDEVCDGTTRKVFAQGHDARMASRLAQMVALGALSAEQAETLIRRVGGGDLLVYKMKHSASLRAARGNGNSKPSPKGKTRKQKEAEELARALEQTSPNVLGNQVRVYHGQRKFAAVVVRSASQDMVARHRLNGQNCDHVVEVVSEDGETHVFTGKSL